MSRFRDRLFFRLALIGTLVASLGLAACGRKGPLDPPPGASVAGEPQTAQPGLMSGVSPFGGSPSSGANSSTVGPDGRPMAPKGEKKKIPLDVLLN